jgi:hypothetical protein
MAHGSREPIDPARTPRDQHRPADIEAAVVGLAWGRELDRSDDEDGVSRQSDGGERRNADVALGARQGAAKIAKASAHLCSSCAQPNRATQIKISTIVRIGDLPHGHRAPHWNRDAGKSDRPRGEPSPARFLCIRGRPCVIWAERPACKAGQQRESRHVDPWQGAEICAGKTICALAAR